MTETRTKRELAVDAALMSVTHIRALAQGDASTATETFPQTPDEMRAAYSFASVVLGDVVRALGPVGFNHLERTRKTLLSLDDDDTDENTED